MSFVHQDPEFGPASPEKRAAIEDAYAKIGPMFWGPRIRLDDACETIRAWLGKLT